jgi:hypothetical protein
LRVAHADGFGVQAFIACELDNESLAEGHETNKWNQKTGNAPVNSVEGRSRGGASHWTTIEAELCGKRAAH